jgi:CRISPR/Cas system-associated endonuclease/helicase Cas3
MSSEYKGETGNGNPFGQFSNMTQPTPEMFTQMMQPMLSANASMIEMQSKMWHTAAEASQQWCEFVSKRLEKDAKFMEQLQNSQTPQAFMDSFTKFSRTMAEDYQHEFSQLSQLSSTAAGGTSEVMRQASESMTALSGAAARS